MFGRSLFRCCSAVVKQSNVACSVACGKVVPPSASLQRSYTTLYAQVAAFRPVHIFPTAPSLVSQVEHLQPLLIAPRPPCTLNISRSVTKFSLRKGKRKTVKAVIRRFKRLDWGIWIRAQQGSRKKLWKKEAKRKSRIRQHVFCNATQSNMLDKMVTRFWRKSRCYPDDPYRPYHKRENFWLSHKVAKPAQKTGGSLT